VSVLSALQIRAYCQRSTTNILHQVALQPPLIENFDPRRPDQGIEAALNASSQVFSASKN
jgi:hypothetical protein